MCGICGALSFSPPPVTADTLQAMCSALRHRGPDDEGVWTAPVGDEDGPRGWVGLGHRRLAVIDPTPRSRQPLGNEDGSIRLVCNGEIYNHRELRRGLEARGHRFRSGSDCEVIPHLYEEEGPAAASRLNGMFAFGLWDGKRRRLWLCRDRLGIKPLVYAGDETRLLFASEIPPLLKTGWVAGGLDRRALALYLAFNYIPAPATAFRGIRKLEPAGSLVLEEGRGIDVTRWWRLPPESSPASGPAAAGTRILLRRALGEAVAGCLLADVPVGAFLSGGLDSGIVLGLMSRLAGGGVPTFTISYPEDPAWDESEAARRIAAFFDCEHHEIPLRGRDLEEAALAVLEGCEEPFADSSAIPTWIVSREAARRVKVVLSGDGGDELFAGYRSYLALRWRSRYRRIPAAIRRGLVLPLLERLPDGRGSRVRETLRRLKKFVRSAEEDELAGLLALKEVIPGPLRRRLAPAGLDSEDPALSWVRALWERHPADPINRMLATDLYDSLPGDMLAKVDRMSMAHGLEVRVPLLDHRVVELAFAIPGTAKMRCGVTKALLREAFGEVLPPGHARRPKAGFEAPLGRLLRGGLAPLVACALDPRRVREQGFLDPAAVGEILALHRRGRTDSDWMVWNLLVLQSWLDRHGLG